ncbi:MAG: serine/threonine protein kinase, partial [Myxococcales bacterium]|nr:serine/threonine protein kinase [Myxococcales bacterium]
MGEGTVERIGGYRIVRRLATGGTSEVLLAKAEGPYGFERTVVLKLLLTKYRDDEAFARMFAREATAYARLSHPSIVRLYDFFSHGGALVMALEHVDGPPLHKLRTMLKNAGTDLDDEASIHIGARLFAALAAAHSARDPATGALAPVMHRDVNPSNVLIPWEGYVKLADFGIAKVAGLPSDTQVGLIKGTYGYMAPEQVRGENVSIRADVYAGAIVLWELFARRKAIYGGALPEVEIIKAMADPRIVPLDVLRPDVDATVREAIARALEPNPDKRLITAEEMVSVLRDACDPDEGREHLVDALERARPHPATERLLKEPTRANRGPVSTLKGMPQVPTPVPPPLASGRTESDLPPALKPALARAAAPAPAPAVASGLPASLHPENVLAELVAGAAAERVSGALGEMFPPSTRSPPTTQRTDPPANVLRDLQEDEETQQRIAPTTAEVEAALAQSDRAPPVGLPPPRPPPGKPPSAAPPTPRVSEDNAMSAALVSAVARELPRMGTLMSNGSPPRPPMAPKPQAAKPAAPAPAAPAL